MKKILIPILLVFISIILIILYKTKDTDNSTKNSIVNTKDTTQEFYNIPSSLRSEFKTDWSKINPKIEKAISGGPKKDGIPAINDPQFESIKDTKIKDSVQAIILDDNNTKKVYPYNILTWHEIVNDTINNIPVSITFCPLCGSSIVFERKIENKILTFGVSGHLIESNMIMYDKETESLWQQSTGKSLAGEYLDKELALVNFQTLDIGQIKETYPDALILDQNTGFNRDYNNNPYSGYEDDESFIFPISKENNEYPSKSIFAVFKINEDVFGIPWLDIEEDILYEETANGNKISIEKKNGELIINNQNNNSKSIPFYFEMWFSLYNQNKDNLTIIKLTK